MLLNISNILKLIFFNLIIREFSFSSLKDQSWCQSNHVTAYKEGMNEIYKFYFLMGKKKSSVIEVKGLNQYYWFD